MLESLFEFLFKYRPAVFAQGDFRFSLSAALVAAVVLSAAGAAFALATYRVVRGETRPVDRTVLAGLRVGALAVVCFCLLHPVLIVKAAVPQQNFVALLLDDSRSMQIADREGEPRGAFVQQTFVKPDSPIVKALADRFMLRTLRFSSSAERLASAGDLTFAGNETRLGEALGRAREELAGLPVAGIVLVSDGADTTESAFGEPLLALKADNVPVFTVGVGREALPHDIQVSRATAPRAVLKGTSLAVDVLVSQTGYYGRTVPLNVETEGRIVGSEEITLPGDGEPVSARVRFTASEAGPHLFRFRVPPQPGETLAQNNAREALIDVLDRREKILYFEGEPRFEVKFLRRAVAGDSNLQLAVLQRTAENKYLRLDIESADELVSAFPRTREELFAYRGLILGSVEAAAFTADQLRMIADFADRRGGGLLMLGGRHSFAEGGYAGTPVADALPVVLDAPPRRDAQEVARLTVRTTRAGAAHAITQIARTEAESAARWPQLPQVTSVNQVRRIKPGATTLLSGTDEHGREQVVLAFERYGRGKTLALPIQDSWVWGFHARMPANDLTHEDLWRQVLRFLVNEVPDPVVITTSTDRLEPGRQTTFDAEVVDSTFVEVNNAHVVAKVTGPGGRTDEIPMQWTGERDGDYRATFVPDEAGVYEARVEATREGKSLGVQVAHLRSAPSDAEYFDAGMRASLLKRIADETGGRFYTRDTVAGLPEDLKFSGRGVTVVEARDLWDMPALLILLVGCILSEWGYRRARGLA